MTGYWTILPSPEKLPSGSTGTRQGPVFHRVDQHLMSTTHWHRLFQAWSNLSTPVRVSADAIASIKAEVAEVTGPILLLGLTSGLMDAGSDITAVDQSHVLVSDLWPGNTRDRRAVVGDWLRLPFEAASFAACIGDGSLISFDYPDRLQLVLAEVARCLKSGGKFACRVFLAPDTAERFADLETVVQQRRISFQHFKFKFAMAMGAEGENPNVRVASIPEFFDVRFPDRGRLAAVTGWDRAEIDTIDIYRKSAANYAFPTKNQLLSVVPKAFEHARFVPVQNHPLGNEWPILVIEAH
jgi:SAM-dependent methyltransferase